jgi:hypothetical protein
VTQLNVTADQLVEHNNLTRGRFLLMGSGEFLSWSAEAERFALGPAATSGPIALLATASAPEGDRIFDGWGTMGLAHFESLGLTARLVQLKTREDASRGDLIDSIEDASMVFFSGGNPAYLASTLDGAPFLNAITKLLSAGAAGWAGVPVRRPGSDPSRPFWSSLEPDARVPAERVDRLWRRPIGQLHRHR